MRGDINYELTNEEYSLGWHFCYDWDGLLVGPGMKEYEEFCTCRNKNDKENIL